MTHFGDLHAAQRNVKRADWGFSALKQYAALPGVGETGIDVPTVYDVRDEDFIDMAQALMSALLHAGRELGLNIEQDIVNGGLSRFHEETEEEWAEEGRAEIELFRSNGQEDLERKFLMEEYASV
ncbi:hypothetical protein [Streptomyces sp. NPDC018045]|uniref:hypothetical protein n=1 Tax=Streptomyces sp. NPDC018045 TaxID=3365037 RepID=UPI0037B13127